MSNMEWYDNLKKLTKGMPPLDAAPDLGMPESEPPSLDQKIHEMDDDELSRAYHIVSKWKAYADYAVGIYAAAEIAYAQRLTEIKHDVYLRLFENNKPKNVKEGEIKVDNDPEVKGVNKYYSAMKAGHTMYRSKASQYAQLAMTYGAERKHRKDLEMASSGVDYD